MGKRELKKQYTELDYNFVDLISLLDTTPTKKMTPFLVKQFNDWVQYKPDEKSNNSEEFETMRRTLGQPKNELDEIIKRMVFKWAQPKLGVISEFTEHMKNNRLDENDINKYDNWNAVKLAINDAEIKQGIKNKKNRVTILHHDDEWLILKPLTFEASVNYGYGTKWCTSMRDSNSYFHKYSRDGILVFAINRKNGVKYAIYSSPKEYSVWTATDARIDSMETIIPFELMIKIKEWTNFDEVGPNYNYFEDEDKEETGKKMGRIRSLRDVLRNDGEDEMGSDEEIISPPPVPVEEDDSEMELDEEGTDWGSNEITTSFVGHSTTVSDELNQPTYVPTTPSGEVMETESYDEEAMDISVDISDSGENMVGLGDSVHGTITEQGERTWDNPYPNGAGGGFNHGAEVVDGLDEEMGVEYDDSNSYEDTERA